MVVRSPVPDMTTDDTTSTGRLLSKANFARFYKLLTPLAVVLFITAFVFPSAVPSVITNTVVVGWLLASLFAFAHHGIKNSTHGI